MLVALFRPLRPVAFVQPAQSSNRYGAIGWIGSSGVGGFQSQFPGAGVRAGAGVGGTRHSCSHVFRSVPPAQRPAAPATAPGPRTLGGDIHHGHLRHRAGIREPP
eukprot:gene15109-biopygen5821